MSNFATGKQNEGVEQAAQPTLCSNNCGFFANVGCTGMCSKCHRESLLELEKKKAAEAAVESAMVLPTNMAVVPAQTEKVSVSTPIIVQPAVESKPALPSTEVAASVASPDSSALKNPGRCQQCRKKVGLTGFKCKCGDVFCGQHRYAEAHNCNFDYKSMDRQKLAANNPVVQASKIQKI